MKKYTKFLFDGNMQDVEFMETMQVIDGVECDVYEFIGDNSKDLGIIRIRQGAQTPRQLVLKGDCTIEGYISGKGVLIIEGEDISNEYRMSHDKSFEITLKIGEKVQWKADEGTDLIAYEICYPPYEDGRYQNL